MKFTKALVLGTLLNGKSGEPSFNSLSKISFKLRKDDIEFIKNYLRKNKDSTCASNKCCVNSIKEQLSFPRDCNQRAKSMDNCTIDRKACDVGVG